MATSEMPAAIGLCFEDRAAWQSTSNIVRADEAARWLAPRSDISLAEALVRDIGIESILIPLSNYHRCDLAKLLSSNRDMMLWNVTDGVTAFCGSLVPSLARIMRIPYFGSSTYVQGLCQHKHHWKAVLTAHGILCSPSAVIRSSENSDYKGAYSLKPPLFVKPTSYGNNAGLSLIDPVSFTVDEAIEKASILIRSGLGPALIEEFAPGHEYSIWGFKTNKWEFSAFKKIMDTPYLLTEVKDRKPTRRIFSMHNVEVPDATAVCEKVVRILEIDDYVRFDVRDDRFGRPLPIDINTGAFLTGRSFDLACRQLKGSATKMFHDIVKQSWARQHF